MNWILINGSDTKQKWSSFKTTKGYLTGKVTPFLKKMNTTKKNVRIINCDNSGKNKTPEENWAKQMNKLTLKIRRQELHRKWRDITGICYTLLKNACDDGAHGIAQKNSRLAYGLNARQPRLKSKTLWSNHTKKVPTKVLR